jgi:NIPSNAP protein
MIRSSTAQKHRILVALLVIFMLSVIVSQHSLASGGEQQNVIHQLRIYEIFDGNKKAFHDRFRDHAMRIMAKYDFNLIATWETKKGNRTEFVYLLEWPNKETMTDRWTKFMQDQELYGPLVGEIQDRALYLTDYSPHKVLSK